MTNCFSGRLFKALYRAARPPSGVPPSLPRYCTKSSAATRLSMTMAVCNKQPPSSLPPLAWL